MDGYKKIFNFQFLSFPQISRKFVTRLESYYQAYFTVLAHKTTAFSKQTLVLSKILPSQLVLKNMKVVGTNEMVCQIMTYNFMG